MKIKYLARRITALENRVDKLERKRFTVSREEVRRAGREAMIEGYERNMIAQLRRQGFPVNRVKWQTPCTLHPDWAAIPDFFLSEDGTKIHWVD